MSSTSSSSRARDRRESNCNSPVVQLQFTSCPTAIHQLSNCNSPVARSVTLSSYFCKSSWIHCCWSEHKALHAADCCCANCNWDWRYLRSTFSWRHRISSLSKFSRCFDDWSSKTVRKSRILAVHRVARIVKAANEMQLVAAREPSALLERRTQHTPIAIAATV